MEFLKNNPKWIRQPKQVQISDDKVVIIEDGAPVGVLSVEL